METTGSIVLERIPDITARPERTDSATGEPVRALWLINHTSLRQAEIPQLARQGIHEVFAPKSFPFDEGNMSADVDATLDDGLTIPAAELAILNRQDWYEQPSAEAWRIANRRFAVLFCAFFPAQLASALRHFHGPVVLRAFGLAARDTYTGFVRSQLPPFAARSLRERAANGRFWFAAAYGHLVDCEGEVLRAAHCHLPLGLPDAGAARTWTGEHRAILLICPRIGSSPYFRGIFEDFVRDFGDLPFAVGGAQPLAVDDPRVLGFLPRAKHEENLRCFRVMYYHSTEPRHIHYHPFEAVRVGMPLIFMAGGMLDRLGGRHLPGRCRSVAEARAKLKRVLAGEQELIRRIQDAQGALLTHMHPDHGHERWAAGIARILAAGAAAAARTPAAKRIAVMVPLAYRGGTMRGARLLAQALHAGSRSAGTPAEVVLGHVDDPVAYGGGFAPEPLAGIPVRPYRWRTLSAAEAKRAMRLAGFEWTPQAERYLIPDDGLSDCDLWVIVSDRLTLPLLPLKPYVMLVFDYLQRYVGILEHGADLPFLRAAQQAERVLVTTRFTEQDALQYAGVPRERVVRVPMLAPVFVPPRALAAPAAPSYFLWTTNTAPHKNHHAALEALVRYYDEHGGTLDCVVTGADTLTLTSGSRPHLREVAALIASHRCLQERVRFKGELADAAYQRELAGAAFLWHAGRIDNGTFSVIEAAHLGVPALSSDYPAMREIDAQFDLRMSWMDPDDPADMAQGLVAMSAGHADRRRLLPSREQLARQGVEHLANAYWEAIAPCL
jgi:glycosyltransferase involved in cell wall biosynthesis